MVICIIKSINQFIIWISGVLKSHNTFLHFNLQNFNRNLKQIDNIEVSFFIMKTTFALKYCSRTFVMEKHWK